MKKAMAFLTLAVAVLIALASPTSAARTLQQFQTAPVSSPQKPASLMFGTASPTARPGVQVLADAPSAGSVSHVPDYHTCPVETGFLPQGPFTTGTGATRCAKTYQLAEVRGDILPGDGTGETRTEVFELTMEPTFQLNGAILLSCYQQVKGFLAAIAGGNPDAATPYIRSDVTLKDEAGQTITGAQAVAGWFALHFGNRPSPAVGVFDVSWEMRTTYPKDTWSLRMTVRAETDTQVVKFATKWDIAEYPYVLGYVYEVRVVNK